LLISAIEDDDPVVFFEPKRLYNGPFYGHKDISGLPKTWDAHALGEVPEEHYSVPIGKASVVHEGSDVTIITYGTMVHVALAAVKTHNLNAEVIDLRSLIPLDKKTIINSVKKTGRCVIVHESTLTGGFGGELLSVIQEACFWWLRAPIERVAGWDVPYPHAHEWDYFPGQSRVVAAVTKTLESD